MSKAVSEAKRRSTSRQQHIRKIAPRKRLSAHQRGGDPDPEEEISDFSDDGHSAKVMRVSRPSWETIFEGMEAPSAAIRCWQAAVAATSPDGGLHACPSRAPGQGVCRNLFLEEEPEVATMMPDMGVPHIAVPTQQNLIEALLEGALEHPGSPPPRHALPPGGSARGSHSWMRTRQAQTPMGDDVQDADDLLPRQGQGSEACANPTTPVRDPTLFNFKAMLDASPDPGPVFYPDHPQQLGLARWIGFSPVRHRKGFFSGLLQTTMAQLQVQYNDWSKAPTRFTAPPPVPSQPLTTSLLIIRITDLHYEYSVAVMDACQVYEGNVGDAALAPISSTSSQAQQGCGPRCRLCLMRQQVQELTLGAGSVLEVHAPWRQVTVQGVPVITAAFFCRVLDTSSPPPPPPSQLPGTSTAWEEPPEVEG
eukprot:GGOE01018661.1.p1 GENE.GGOE01018661.1~~GGOE01018661.1.p1  ORF type:complete len:421 (+),score=58.69 GGOE01018661.1:578-1840(+)